MYKAKVEAWKINKKLGMKEYHAALQVIKEQCLHGKYTEIVVGDRVVPLRKLKRFCRTHNIDFPTQSAVTSATAGSRTQKLIASKPVSLPNTLDAPECYRNPARLFECFKRYVYKMFSNGTWKLTGTDAEIEASVFATKNLMLVEEQYDILWISKAFQEEDNKKALSSCWNRLFENMASLLRSTYPTVLRRIIVFVEYFHNLDLPELAAYLHKYVPQMASEILPETDPRRSMFEALAYVDSDQKTMQYCYENIARLFAEILEKELGAKSAVAYRRRLDYIRNSERRQPSESLDDRLPSLYQVDREYGPFSDVAMGLLSTRLILHYKRKEYDKVLEVGPQLVFRTEHAPHNYRACRFLIQAQVYLGLALYELKHFEDSRQRFKRALEENSRPQAFHSGHECFYETHRCMTMLENIARAMNEPTGVTLWRASCAEAHTRFLKTVIEKPGEESDIVTSPGLPVWTQGGCCGGPENDVDHPYVKRSLTL